ncbi:redoxin domain-containing protein [Allosaccharopolyspora coralli]|uniref:thioredoxin-dependent peroxiredoxin n=1 Tax=Allosaccharopolyspora coralli TaxID=2665642 RepID=A0A5Q3Q5D0_9PSEU|nr:peroxiredoxin [Allosaccharopolyspora coralli]QGK69543.1 redoxin domain-containing protein [Allosaccharopolyspora coralli]
MRPGDLVDDFTLTDQTGTDRSLSALLADGPIVLFFYPAAMTGGCTAESCHFRDLTGELAEVGARPVGISTDAVTKQREFDEAHSFGFPLLSDPHAAVARQFGVARRFGPLPVKRHTFVIGTDRRIIDVIRSEFRMSIHADKALETLRTTVS